MSTVGDRLYRLVVEYSNLGDHRTGTAVDDATRAWFESQLVPLGARTEQLRYAFSQFVASSWVDVAGCEVESVPLWYSGVGSVETDAPYIAQADALTSAGVDEALADGRARGATAAVIATQGSGGRVTAVNRAAELSQGPPAVLVPGDTFGDVERGPVRVSIDGSLREGASATVIGWFGESRAEPVVVTTPLSGWFTCAGERGTGIAVALDVAASLAPRHPVVVVGTTGHELWHLGARDFLGRVHLTPRAVVHLGAGVAAGDPVGGGIRLGSLRVALVDGIDVQRAGSLRDALEPSQCALVRDLPDWPGEGRDWRALGAPVLSIIGGFDRFHTRDDVPGAATTPELLETVLDAVTAASELLVA